jgi:hypothetical protein
VTQDLESIENLVHDLSNTSTFFCMLRIDVEVDCLNYSLLTTLFYLLSAILEP